MQSCNKINFLFPHSSSNYPGMMPQKGQDSGERSKTNWLKREHWKLNMIVCFVSHSYFPIIIFNKSLYLMFRIKVQRGRADCSSFFSLSFFHVYDGISSFVLAVEDNSLRSSFFSAFCPSSYSPFSCRNNFMLVSFWWCVLARLGWATQV